MDVDTLVRDASKIHAILEEKDSSLLVTKPCKVYIPVGYMGASLGVDDDKFQALAIFPIVLDDKYYAVCQACALMTPGMNQIQTVEIEGEEFFELLFEPGDELFTNLDLVQIATITFRVYDYFEAKGKVPWFINADDLSKLFETAKIHAGVSLGVDQAILEMYATVNTRDPNNRRRYFRHAAIEDQDKRADFIPLRSVSYSATNTTARLQGNYFDEGMTSLLTNPSFQVQSIESQLRNTKQRT